MPLVADDSRALVHAVAGLPAFLLPYLSFPMAVALAMTALLFNGLVLPRTSWGQDWRGRRSLTGVIVFPLTVLVLLLLFWGNPMALAAGWGTLAFGDSAASIIGRRWPLRPLPYARQKSMGGGLGYLVAASIGVFVLAMHMGAGDVRLVSRMAFCAAVVGAFVESLPIPINDNITAPLAAASLIAVMGS